MVELDMLEAALAHAKKGYKVFPCCWPDENGKCACGNKSPSHQAGKSPVYKKGLMEHGSKEASSDSEQIRKWWTRWPDANIGMATTGYVVADFDKGKRGASSRTALEAEYSELPLTLTHRTGGGGLHYIYSNPTGEKVTSVNGLRNGVDRKADGGYIIMPPSLHSSQNRYKALNEENIAPAPKWLMELEKKKLESDEEKGAIRVLDGVPEGERDEAIYKYASRLFGKKLSKSEVIPLVLLAASRCTPPFPEKDALVKVESAAKYEHKPAAAFLGEPPEIFSAREVAKMDLPPLISVLPGMIVAGLTIMTAKPKAGKGWWVLQAAYSVALGKNLFDGSECEKGRVLYMGLEDSLLRLQYRINEVNDSTIIARSYMKDGGLHTYVNFGRIPEGLDLTIRWPKIDEGCIEYLEKYLDEHSDTRLIIIDIFKRIAKAKKGKGSTYEEDYESIQPVQELATRRKVAIIVVHHNRKAGAEDPIDMVSGTFGLTGGVDSVIVIQKISRGETYDESKFSFIGRDIDEQELAMKFDKRSHIWSLIGDADTHFISKTRKEILENLGDGSMLPGELAKLMGRNVSTIQSMLIKMLNDGLVDKNDKGKYSVFKIQINSKRFRKDDN